MKNADVVQLYSEVILPTYRQTPVCLVKGKRSRVWDIEGKEYLDFFPGWGVSGLGHCHPKVVSAIKDQASKILHISNNYLNLKQARLAEALNRIAFPSRLFFANSGAEANEAAIKFARKFGQEEGRTEIITALGSFHGRTLGALTATGQLKYQEGFAPLPEGFKYVPFNDTAAFEKALTPKTVALLVEPIQGEGGIQVASKEYLQEIRSLCDERKILLILDEVQTGMGRTGKWFAFQHYGIEPDLMTLAKSLGGGVPIGALLVHRRVGREVLTPGTHATTYGGNPLVAAAALAVIKAIQKEKLLKNAEVMGGHLRSRLEEIQSQYPQKIKEIRGIGLMLGMELTFPGDGIVDRCRERGLLINCTQERVLRIMPAMTVTKREVDQAVKIIGNALSKETSGK